MALTLSFPVSHRPPLPTDFPGPPGRRLRSHPTFTGLEVLFGCPIARRASLPTSLCAYRVGYPGATREHDEPSWGRVQIFRTVPLANTLVRRVGKNAFAAIVPARPCPVFGRPIRHGVAPSTTARYFSASPSDSTSRWTPCPPVVSRYAAALGRVIHTRRLGGGILVHPSRFRPQSSALDCSRIRFDEGICEPGLPIDARKHPGARARTCRNASP